MKLGRIVGGVTFGLCLFGCVASRGPVDATDGGKASDGSGGGDADVSSCPALSGGNDLSFDLTCMGVCTQSGHIDFHLDTTSKGYPGCAIGGQGLFQFPNLAGNDESTLALQISGYTGTGKYTIAGSPSLLDFQAALPTDSGVCSDLVGLIPSPGSGGEAGAAGQSCTIDVTQDCVSASGHTVAGTIECNLLGAEANSSCKITNGKFSFGDCP